MICKKIPYGTKADAERAVRELIADSKRSGQGKSSWRRLNSYLCSDCGRFHIGRANQLPFRKQQPKPPTPGELRRQQKHAEKEQSRTANRKARHVFAQIGFLVDVADAAKIATERLDDFRDSMEQARKMAARFIFVK